MKLLYIFALPLLFNYFILIAIYRYLFSLSGGYLMFPHFTLSGTTYQALHRKLTLFCTCVTQIILLALSALCVFVAEKNIKQGNETAFLT